MKDSRPWREGGSRRSTRVKAAITCLALLGLVSPGSAAHAELQAGAAKLTITPPECSVGGPCPGYSLAGGPLGRFSTKVHDDIWVRALVMTSNKDSVILITCDVLQHMPDRIIGMHHDLWAAYPSYVKVLVYNDGVTPPVTQRYVDGREVIANVLIADAHTHASPDGIGIYGPNEFTSGIDPIWLDYVDSRVVEVVGLAISNLQRAKVRFGRYYVPDYLGFPLTTDNREPIVLDHNLEVMQLANQSSDEVICTLVNHSAYPDMMGQTNTEMTADFPGVVDQNLETRYGGTAIWFTRTIGGITSSYYDVNFNGLADDDGYLPNQHLHSFAGMTAYGNLMADIVEEALDGIPYEGSPDISLNTRILNLPLENPLFKLLLGEVNYVVPGLLGDVWMFLADWIGMTSIFEATPDLLLDHEGQGALGATRKVQTPVTVFTLGSAMFSTTPGQAFPELWVGTSPADLLANPAWDFHPSRSGNPDFEPHPRIPGLTGIRDFITAEHAFNLGSTQFDLGYLVPEYEYDYSMKTYQDFVGYIVGTHHLRYEEGFSVGREAASMVRRELIGMIAEFNAGLVH